MDGEVLGQRIAYLRKRLNISQGEVARRCGFGDGDSARARVSNWEKGRFKPETDSLPLLARALECTIDDILLSEELDSPVPSDRPSWVDDLTRTTEAAGRAAADAILHQENAFVAAVAEQRAAYNEVIKDLTRSLTDMAGAINDLREEMRATRAPAVADLEGAPQGTSQQRRPSKRAAGIRNRRHAAEKSRGPEVVKAPKPARKQKAQ